MKAKNPNAVALGKLGAAVSNAGRTPEERKVQAQKAIAARWAKREESTTAGARSQRKRRQLLKKWENQ